MGQIIKGLDLVFLFIVGRKKEIKLTFISVVIALLTPENPLVASSTSDSKRRTAILVSVLEMVNLSTKRLAKSCT
tara:strand:- start:543 stop:767 length:225 start_codon:yes stop_codon:yes gene_type:complete